MDECGDSYAALIEAAFAATEGAGAAGAVVRVLCTRLAFGAVVAGEPEQGVVPLTKVFKAGFKAASFAVQIIDRAEVVLAVVVELTEPCAVLSWRIDGEVRGVGPDDDEERLVAL